MTFDEKKIWKLERTAENLGALSYSTAMSALLLGEQSKGAMVVASETMNLRKYLLKIVEQQRFAKENRNDQTSKMSYLLKMLSILSMNARIEGHHGGLNKADKLNSLLTFCSRELTQSAMELSTIFEMGKGQLYSEDYPRVNGHVGEELQTLISFQIGGVPFYEKLDNVREILITLQNVRKIDGGNKIFVRGHKWTLIDSYSLLELPRPECENEISIVCLDNKKDNRVSALMVDNLKLNCIFESPQGSETDKGPLPVDVEYIRSSWSTTDKLSMNFLDWEKLSQ